MNYLNLQLIGVGYFKRVPTLKWQKYLELEEPEALIRKIAMVYFDLNKDLLHYQNQDLIKNWNGTNFSEIPPVMLLSMRSEFAMHKPFLRSSNL
jgi:hypothetical protein